MGAARRSYSRRPSQAAEEWQIRCVCGATEEGDDNSEPWIACDKCGTWQHNICMGLGPSTEDSPEYYQCEKCSPEAHMELLQSSAQGGRLWEDRRKTYEQQLASGEKTGERTQNHITSSKDEEEPKVDAPIATLSLTEDCHHYTRRADVPWDIQKYWDQRHSIFSCYDEGIYMTDDSWFGITPEPVANEVASDLAGLTVPSKEVLIDLFAGAGGNTIAFALSDRWSTVIAIEKDPSIIACAQHNAAIYGVSNKITWINDDCFSYLTSNSSSIAHASTVIFASPPWGGPGYKSDEVFDLSTMQPYSANHIYDSCRGMDLALYLPRTSNLRQIARLAPEGKKIEVVQYCMDGASKALVAYIPAAVTSAS